MNGVLLRPLPYRDPDRLVMLRIDAEGAQGYPGLSAAEIEALREHSKAFQSLGAMLGFTVSLTGAGEMEQLPPAVLILFAAAAFLLLLACTNTANLQMARNRGRRAEMALRTTLGATRSRIVRQILTENLLTALLAAVAALLLAWTALKGLPLIVELPLAQEVALDWRVMLFALAVASGCGMLFGMIPAWQATRWELNEMLKQGGRSIIPNGLRNGLLISQLALARWPPCCWDC
ncbi:MAG: FtsX-like permease family protein [Acidobacteriota bacterium]